MRGQRHIRSALLVLVLLLLGHDALMAAAPHRESTSGMHQGHTLHAPGYGQGIAEVMAVADGALCLMADDIRRATPETSPPDGPEQEVEPAVPVPPRRESGRISWSVAPSHPPGVRRALLQVYLN